MLETVNSDTNLNITVSVTFYERSVLATLYKASNMYCIHWRLGSQCTEHIVMQFWLSHCSWYWMAWTYRHWLKLVGG